MHCVDCLEGMLGMDSEWWVRVREHEIRIGVDWIGVILRWIGYNVNNMPIDVSDWPL